MEKTDRAAVIPADIGWSDVGSWTALDDVSNHDASGNVIAGNVIDIDSHDSIIYAEKRLVATIGLKDVVVVDTPDATLVCSKDRAQDVKKVVEVLKKRKTGEHLIHLTVHRPWGSYTILEEGDRYKIKRLVIQSGDEAVPSASQPPERALGRRLRDREGDQRRECLRCAPERKHLYPHVHKAPARKPRQDTASDHRSAEWRIS